MRNTSLLSVASATITSEPGINDLDAQLQRFTNHFEENPDDTGEYTVAWEGPPPWGPHELLDGRSFKDAAIKYRTWQSFLPRKGELVLFYLNKEPDCRFDESTQHFKMFDKVSGEVLGFPTWRAGVIAAEPEEQLGHEDLFALPADHLEVTNKSFRIELYPDPESRDKRLSNEAHIIPLNRIRPLGLFHEFLSGLPQKDWHETIRNALKSMNTACLVDPIEFSGKWFSYSIRYRGIWIGPELYIEGDAVRLLPARGNDTQVDQVMIINRIDHRFENDNVHDERSSIVVAGPVITINKNRSFRDTPFTIVEKQELLLPASTAGYTWYPIDVSTDVHPKEVNYEGFLDDWQEVPVSYIVGRLYDLKVMKILLNISSFDVGGLGMKQARRWAKKHRDNMKVNAHQEWILTVDRIQALGIEILNGRAVGKVEREVHKGRNGNCQGTEISSGRSHKDSGQSRGESFSRPFRIQNGNGGTDEIGDEKGHLEKALETSDIDENIRSDTIGNLAQGLKSVVTDRTHNWSADEDEGENAEKFISEVIAGNVLPTENEEVDGAIVDGAQNGESPERERPMKRPRF